MRINKHIPLVTTPRLSAVKEFYTQHLGFRPTLDAWRRRRDRGRGMPDPLWAEICAGRYK